MLELISGLILGLAAGILAVIVVYRAVPKEPMALIGAGVVGLIGGLIGHWVADLLGIASLNWIGSLVIGFLGAVGILMLLQKMNPRGSKA